MARPREAVEKKQTLPQPEPQRVRARSSKEADEAAVRAVARPREAAEKMQTPPQPDPQRVRSKPPRRCRRRRSPIRNASARGRREVADSAAARAAAHPREAVDKNQTLPLPDPQRIRARPSKRSRRSRSRAAAHPREVVKKKQPLLLPDPQRVRAKSSIKSRR